MKLRLVACAFVSVLAAACNTASPVFMGIAAQTVTVERSTFDVRRKGESVELLRTNREAVFSLAGIVPRATKAVIQVTGCAPIAGTWTGDHAMMRVQIDCDT